MYNSAQLRALARVSALALLTFAVLNVAMSFSTVLAPGLFWVPKQFFGVDFVRENYQRVLGAEAYFRDTAKADENLIVVLGLSSASEGISVRRLEAASRERALHHRYLSLSGAGRNAREIDIYARPLINRELEPALVVLAISPFHLMDPPNHPPSPGELFAELTMAELTTGWFSTKRGDLRHLLDMKILRARSAIFELLDNRVDEKRVDPWRENTFMGLMALTRPAQWQAKLNQYGERGYYSLENYENSQQQIRILATVLQGFAGQGTRVMIVLMPEHSSLRQSVPGNALEVLLAELGEQIAPAAIPRLVDMREAVADEGFNDISHLNATGRAAFTEMLDRVVQAELR